MTPDPKQRTGRTTRMLAEARRLRDEGRAVYVVFDSVRGWSRYDTPENAGLRFESLSSLRTLDLATGRLVGSHPNCVVLMDHYAVERHFRWMLDQWTRFDPKETP